MNEWMVLSKISTAGLKRYLSGHVGDKASAVAKRMLISLFIWPFLQQRTENIGIYQENVSFWLDMINGQLPCN